MFALEHIVPSNFKRKLKQIYIFQSTLTSVASDLICDALWLDNELSARPPRGRYGQWTEVKIQMGAYKSFDKIGKSNVMQHWFLRTKALQVLEQYIMWPEASEKFQSIFRNSLWIIAYWIKHVLEENQLFFTSTH